MSKSKNWLSIPDPVFLFMWLYVIVFILLSIFGGTTFSFFSAGGGTTEYVLKDMSTNEGIRWIFSNAILTNWLSFANGLLGIILIIMFGIGLCEESGLFATLLKKASKRISDRYLPYFLVFLGVMSNITSDAGYIILIPMAGLLYVGIGKNPIIGMAAVFAGVSAGFSANLIPATVFDVVMGSTTKSFADASGVPFVSALGDSIEPPLMHYYFMVASTFLLVLLGGFITNRFIRPRFENESYEVPHDLETFEVSKSEDRALKYAGLGFLLVMGVVVWLYLYPLSSYESDGKVVKPFINNIILVMTLIFAVCGLFFGFASGRFKNSQDVINAMSRQVGSMGYVVVLTFFCYNFLALFNYSSFGIYISYLGSEILVNLGLNNYPFGLIIGFVIIAAVINLFVGSLSAKWLLLGPIFVPILYHANHILTPDIVSAAYRIADSSTNIISPLMPYAGIVLMYMRKYVPNLTFGTLIWTMVPYSISFLVAWVAMLFIFIFSRLPLGM